MSTITEEEKKVLDKLSEAWSLFLKLPRQHPQEIAEMLTAIHHAQDLVLIRPTIRSMGWIRIEKDNK